MATAEYDQPAPGQSCLESWQGSLTDPAMYWRLTLTERDAVRMSREQREMIEDGIWLITAMCDLTNPLSDTVHGLIARRDRG